MVTVGPVFSFGLHKQVVGFIKAIIIQLGPEYSGHNEVVAFNSDHALYGQVSVYTQRPLAIALSLKETGLN